VEAFPYKAALLHQDQVDLSFLVLVQEQLLEDRYTYQEVEVVVN
jgi:hypothetical protein